MKRLKAVLQLLLPYVSIILLSMMAVSFLVRSLVESYQERIVAEKQKSFEIAAERFRERLDNIEQIAYNIEGNTVIEKYAYGSLQNTQITIADRMEVQDEIDNFTFNSNISNIYVYDSKNDTIFSSDTMLRDSEGYFQYNYNIIDLTPEEAIDRLMNPQYNGYSSVISVATRGNVSEYIEYKLQIPIEWRSTHALQMVLAIDAGRLFEDFFEIMDERSGFYIYDENAELVYGYGSTYKELLVGELLSGEQASGKQASSEQMSGAQLSSTLLLGKQTPSELTSNLKPVPGNEQIYCMVYQIKDRNWNIVFICPNLVKSSGMKLPHFSATVMLPIAAAVFLSIYFTYKNYKEIISVMRMLNIHTGNADKQHSKKTYLGSIKESVASLIDENSKYKERINDYSSARKVEIMDKLVRSAYENREEISTALKEIDFKMWDRNCVVLCIRYEGSDYRKEIDKDLTIKALVREMIPQLAERETQVFDSTARETVCILFMEDGINSEVVVRNIIARLNVEIFYAYGIEVKIGAGNIADSVYNAADSYKQAKEVIKYRETAGSNVYLYSDLKQMEDNYYYPAEFDEMIYNYVVAGKADSAKEIMHRLYSDNMEKSTGMLSVTAIEMLKKRLEGGMLSMAKKYHISTDSFLVQWHQEQNVGRYFNLMYDFIDWMADEIGEKRDSIQSQLGSKILDYINAHYSENSLSLKQIAGEFGFQENYTSRLFKSIYGENLSVVIERIRIEKACELLKNAELKISDISEAVGYNSDISFRRAFKKVTGMTPLEYRETKQTGN